MNKFTGMTYEEFENLPTLGLDDTFDFSCKECGKCKYNRNDILLTPYDLFRVASYFGRTPQEIIERYCEVYEGQTSHLPVVRVLSVPPDGSCPFLRGKKCAVHAKKPVLCRTYPLAKIRTDEKTLYHFAGSSCKSNPKTITVREWLADVASDEAEEAGALWWEISKHLYTVLLPENLNVPADTRKTIINTVFIPLYLIYDIAEPFLPQFQRNIDELKAIFQRAEN